MLRILVFFCLLGIIACDTSPNPPQSTDAEAVARYDFESDGTQGWTTGVSDYPLDTLDGVVNFESGIASVPNSLNGGSGLRVAGNDPKADLFLFIKQQFGPLQTNRSYQLAFNIALATQNLGTDTLTVNDNVDLALKIGSSKQEPIVEEGIDSSVLGYPAFLLNIDKGNGSQGGTDLDFTGLVRIGTAPQEASEVVEIGFSLIGTTDSNGFLWITIGTDSQTGVPHAVFYEGLTIEFFPI